jgi:peptide chain release factor 1
VRHVFRTTEEEDIREMAREELVHLESTLLSIEEDLAEKLTPKDPNDNRSVIVEIRAGAGGEEAALFVGVLYRMYGAYAQSKGWRTEYIDSNETEIGGYKEIVFSVEGRGAFSKFSMSSGVHRVQRVPLRNPADACILPL